ncbi:LLM class flavin-dependent oxidoreductase [Oceanobacillus arenosus]|uniref:LLM class flavin-dependent oxidoreductase n=1 Tax=Oceanobacillus arenosus TaxID=1229153 RepID=A0A3D8PSA1_9BACI|nr:LLM class flavin-dependent oxidoreductase [Oceanobacillus arenosus]RDW19030.1 LLM class flavin-dependent oxidoreductase [Oceanobacillus arenosus]
MTTHQDDQTPFEIGIYTLGDIVTDPLTGETISAGERTHEIIEAAKLADQAGLDVFGIGEHHRLDYAISSPQMVLSAIAQVTKNIKLTSATTVLNTVDPVRLFEEFATLDLISNGRAEITAGRGAFVESFPLFGYHFDDYDALFEEHLQLLMKLNESERVTWSGKYRSSLNNSEIAPRPAQDKLPIWTGVGGTISSAARAGKYGTGLTIAMIGGEHERFLPLIDAYQRAGRLAGNAEGDLKVGVTGHGFIADSMEEAKDAFYPYYAQYMQYMSKQRGQRGEVSRVAFDYMTRAENVMFIGSPQEVTEKILYQHEMFGHKRFMLQMDIGGMPFSHIANTIELLATKVAPVVRREVAKQVRNV